MHVIEKNIIPFNNLETSGQLNLHIELGIKEQRYGSAEIRNRCVVFQIIDGNCHISRNLIYGKNSDGNFFAFPTCI